MYFLIKMLIVEYNITLIYNYLNVNNIKIFILKVLFLKLYIYSYL
jgi:hypothetical protein